MQNIETKYNTNKSALFKWSEAETPPDIREYSFATALWYDFEINRIAPVVFEYMLERCMRDKAGQHHDNTLEVYFLQKANHAIRSIANLENCASNLHGLIRVHKDFAASLESGAFRISFHLPEMITTQRLGGNVENPFIPDTSWLRPLDRFGDSMKKEVDRFFSSASGLEAPGKKYAWMCTKDAYFEPRPTIKPFTMTELAERFGFEAKPQVQK